MTARLTLSRKQILAFRQRAGTLDERLPRGRRSLRRAAWCGLQDSMPRAAVLSIAARVAGVRPDVLDDPSLVQIWGPRYGVFVVPATDLAVFTLGAMPHDAKGRTKAEDTAERLDTFLAGRTMTYAKAGHGMGVHPNSLRYGAATGRILIKWEGARAPLIWTVPAPAMGVDDARRELTRRYLHVYGPATPGAFARWAGIPPTKAAEAFGELGIPVRTPIGEAWMLASDEALARAAPGPAAPARLLPSGDAYWLFHGVERELLVPDARRRGELWTPRVWPGAVLVNGEIVGIWRRAHTAMSVQLWRKVSRASRAAIEAEALAFPLSEGPAVVSWEG
ncbi:MAG TPA: crosslink repair DNA glycosylase YcaQ family protein [Actinomycetota bacterium]|nr:crosslink repair DNA glycosylase YcaQ family protein [Actinomycetota bacterium]